MRVWIADDYDEGFDTVYDSKEKAIYHLLRAMADRIEYNINHGVNLDTLYALQICKDLRHLANDEMMVEDVCYIYDREVE